MTSASTHLACGGRWRLYCFVNRHGDERVTVRRLLVFIAVLPWAVAGQDMTRPPHLLPPSATSALATSLQAAAAHAKHEWRDTAPTSPDGTVNAYIEHHADDHPADELTVRQRRS